MKKIVIGGQMNQSKICSYINKSYSDEILAYVSPNSISGTLDLQNNAADYYFGFCLTGSGGALIMPKSILGEDNCFVVSSPSSICSETEIKKALKAGKKVFGFYVNTYKISVSRVIQCILEENIK